MIHSYSNSDKPAGPRIHHFGEVSSTFDAAHELVAQGRLPVWDSVVAVSQTRGRGQMRRRWSSPPGNLYATIRLPDQAPFNNTGATVAIGALLANALRGFGCKTLLKWPNDIVTRKGADCAKLAGILLEERDGVLLAGIGINVGVTPEIEPGDGDCSLPAADMASSCTGDPVPPPAVLWQSLLRHFYSAYKSGSFFSSLWKDAANELLLWRGENVIVSDGGECLEGRLAGVGAKGGALIESGSQVAEILSGRLCLARGAGKEDGQARDHASGKSRFGA